MPVYKEATFRRLDVADVPGYLPELARAERLLGRLERILRETVHERSEAENVRRVQGRLRELREALEMQVEAC